MSHAASHVTGVNAFHRGLAAAETWREDWAPEDLAALRALLAPADDELVARAVDVVDHRWRQRRDGGTHDVPDLGERDAEDADLLVAGLLVGLVAD